MIEAVLNDEGKRVWGYAFHDGKIPVTAASPSTMQLGDAKMDAYMVAWDDLEPVQRAMVLSHLAKKFSALERDVEKDILTKGLPLRASLVSCIVIPARFF